MVMLLSIDDIIQVQSKKEVLDIFFKKKSIHCSNSKDENEALCVLHIINQT